MSEGASFLSRWSQRKAQVKGGRSVADEPALPSPAPVVVPPTDAVALQPTPAGIEPMPAAPATEAPPAPTLDDVQQLAPGDEISRFVARGVDESVKRAAVKKLFADPHFNVMDGLDIYIDDYSQPDPIPMSMLRQLNQAKFMNLFAEEEAAEAAAAAAASGPPFDEAPSATPPPAASLAQDAGTAAPVASAVPHALDEDPDLQLQSHDPARRPGA